MVLYRPIRHPHLSFLGVITIVYNPYPFRHEKTFMFSCALGSKGLYCCYSTFFLRGLSFNHPSLSLKWMDFFGWGWLHVTKKKHWDFTSVWAATGTPSAASEKQWTSIWTRCRRKRLRIVTCSYSRVEEVDSRGQFKYRCWGDQTILGGGNSLTSFFLHFSPRKLGKIPIF